MPREKDPFWKHVTFLNENNSKWRCNFCGQEHDGGATRIKAHLAGIARFGIKGCERVDVDVRAEARDVLMPKKAMDSRDRGVSEERIPGNVRAAPTSTTNPPNVERGTYLQLPHGMSKQPASLHPKFQNVTEASYMNATNAVVYLNPSPAMTPPTQNRELMEEMPQEMRAADIANPPLDGATSYYSASPPANSSFNEQLNSFNEFFDLGTSNAQHNPGAPLPSVDRHLPDNIFQNELTGLYFSWSHYAQLSKMATTSTPQHSSQPLQSNSQCGYGTGLEPPVPSLPFNRPLVVESIPQIREDIINTIGPRTSEGESTSCSTEASGEEVLCLVASPHQPRCPFLSPYPVEMPMNDQRTSTGASSFQDDQLPSVDNSNCLQDCNQHSQLQTPLDRDPSIASQHASDPHTIERTIDDLQVPEVATNTTGPSSSQDMNRGSPTMNVRSISAKDEEVRNLKRKVEELTDKEAVMKKQMEIDSAASSVRKKRRILVEKWLKETERATNDFQIIGQANAETLPPKEQVETLTREVEELIEQMTLLIEARGVKGDEFLLRKLIGEAIFRNIELIWDHLKANHVRKLGIYGMGGVGKTTIMIHIHNRLIKDAAFDGVAFVTMSEDFSNYKMQSCIWKALNFGVMEDEHEKKRAAKLSKCLERKKNCVLILDDVWDHSDLEEVGIPITIDGFKLVLTSRSYDVCCQMQCQEKIKIKPLSHKEAESLFLEELGSEVALNLEIESIVKSIVKECAGLPIGVITMARSMRGVTDVFEWKDSLVKLRESNLGQTNMEKVLMKLEFSYNHLGNREVQQCFLSCALYPKDELIQKFELIEFFIDQRLIGGLITREKQYDRGLTILNKLDNVCLLEDHGSEMKMHNLIRHMALHTMSVTSIVKARKGLTRIPTEEYWTDALEEVSLMENRIREFPLNMSPNCPKLSTFLLNGSLWFDVIIPDSFFKQLQGLKVLNLSRCHLRELPNSISYLVNLWALLLRECRELRWVPHLGKLRSLRKLDIHGCFHLEALEGVEMLVNLRYLDLIGTPVKRLPKGTMEVLLNLQYLGVPKVNKEDIAKLWALKTLECHFEDVDDFNKCVRAIKQSNNPRYYHLCAIPEKSFFLVKVSDDARFGNCRRSVTIREWNHAIMSVGGESNGICILTPQDVQTLTMGNCDGTTNLSDMGPLENLEELLIEEWENLRVLCGGQNEVVINIHDSPVPTPTPLLFPSLRVLKIYRCPKLKYLFGHGSKFYLLHLQEIEISHCQEMVGITTVVTSPPPPSSLAFPSLEVISIMWCDKMKRVVESEWLPHFSNLRVIIIYSCENMEEIIRGPPPYVPVEEIFLESLFVHDCNNMRKLFQHELLIHLRNLQTINVNCCKGMVEMISGAGQDQERNIMTHPLAFQSSSSLPKLKRLWLHDLAQLKSICGVPISCDSMEDIEVSECPELSRIPLQLHSSDIEGLPLRGIAEDTDMGSS